jgi:hydroxyacylglutathione hydrolase
MAAQVHQFLCYSDNFGVLVHDPVSGATASIDAPEAGPIKAALAEKGWTLTHILVTHHHNDHIDGIAELIAGGGVQVIVNAADAARVPMATTLVKPDDIVSVGGLSARVIDTPGHTIGHISYHFPNDHLLFAGDTLFSGGCGRMFEGNPEGFWGSLAKLRALPDATMLYCGHEYTLSNVKFALAMDPDNAALKTRAAEVEALRAAGQFTLPVSLGVEKATNPFLRVDDPAIRKGLGMESATDVAVFGELRERKNNF